MTKFEFLERYISFDRHFYDNCSEIGDEWWLTRDEYLVVIVNSYGANDEMSVSVSSDTYHCQGEVYLGKDKKKAKEKFIELFCENITIKWDNEYDEM